MSTDGTRLLFEGFLKKRKDTMKIRWSTYWFRLQNTTLFFYNKKGGSALHLRGLYYIYTVQSVREVPREDSKGFVFEITMTNGKRKVLAAETAALRKEWIGQLWQAMHLSNPEASTRLGVCPQRERGHSIVPYSSGCDDDTALGVRPVSAPACPIQNLHQNGTTFSSISFSEEEELNSEDPIQQNSFSVCDGHAAYAHKMPGSKAKVHETSGFKTEEETQEEVEEVDYDILPPPKMMYEMNGSSEEDLSQDEGLHEVPPQVLFGDEEYDVPLSYRWLHDHQEHREAMGSIYNVPSTLLRTTSDEEEDLEVGVSLLEDMMASLGGESTSWGARETASARPYTPIYF